MLIALAAGSRAMANGAQENLDGRAVDQIQGHPGDPRSHEPLARDAMSPKRARRP
jgi:hypothetical protein